MPIDLQKLRLDFDLLEYTKSLFNYKYNKLLTVHNLCNYRIVFSEHVKF